jgi:exodeoxyribonuclease VII small subunit
VTTTDQARDQATGSMAHAPTDAAVEALSFDDALAELQRVVAELETGGQPLEAAIALYERGVALQARCERLISDAELRVQQLVARAGGALETRDVRPEEATEPG